MSNEPDHIDLYWRPGCPFCTRLDRQLSGVDLPIRRHNIWDDPEAAATVRSVADGNETVPTIVVGTRGLVNPTLDELISAVRSEAPALAAGLPEPSERSGLRRFFG